MIRTSFLELICDDCIQERTVVCVENNNDKTYVCGSCLGTNVHNDGGTRCESCWLPDSVVWEDGHGTCKVCGWVEED